MAATGGALPVLPTLAVAGATACLFAGGVALNDWFDRRLDADERPLRPIPSGRISEGDAVRFGSALLLFGLALSALAGAMALLMAGGVVALIVSYNAFAKRDRVIGPANMGLIRGLNFMLGVALVPAAVAALSPLALVYAAVIAGVTLVARGEVGGARRVEALAAAGLVVASFALFAYLVRNVPLLPHALPFAAAWIVLVGGAFLLAARDPRPSRVHRAVKMGVLGLLLLDAAVAAAAGGWPWGLAVALLLAPAFLLARAIPIN